MRHALPMGSVGGVPVRLHWSALITLGVATWVLGGAVLPTSDPGLPVGSRWAIAVGAGALFLASLLAHEAAHALLARRNGVPVGSVTLWLLGGVAELRGDPPGPGAEARIVGVGPLTSVGCAAVFAGLAAGGAALRIPDVATTALGWLALVNLALAVFNTLPAAPLDGGRLLHALLWWRTGDRLRATRVVSNAGRVLGAVLMGLGVVEVILASGIGGLWLVLVGWFLFAAAGNEQRVRGVVDALGGRRVRDVMTPEPLTVPATWSVARTAAVLSEHPTHADHIPVVDAGGRAAGLVALADLVRVPPLQRPFTALGSVARPVERLVCTRPDEDLSQLLARLPEREGSPPALVLNDGLVVGIVGPGDIRRASYRAQLGSRTVRGAHV